MTNIIYYSDSISKIISVFAIECVIVFSFIILFIFYCLGKFISSSDYTNQYNDIFMFNKYSSKYKIEKEEIDSLYLKKNVQNNKKTNQNKISKLLYLFNCFKNNNEQKLEESNLEQVNELKTIDKIKEINNNNKFNQIYNIDIESGLISNKIFIVYEFNNFDKNTKLLSYINSNSSNSDSEDEFDELEYFVNMIIKSFKSKYDQVGILLKISSSGGSASKFEHAYLNLLRLRDKKIELIGLIDKMAASGSYILASACDKIICSQYAIIGSIGQLYNQLELNKNVEFEKNLFLARTNYIKENNARMIEETFNIFKYIIIKARKFTSEQIEEILKKKTFLGFEALKLNMVDELKMSYDYMDRLNMLNNIWICNKKIKSNSYFNSLLMKNTNIFTTSLIEKIYNKIVFNKKKNSIKLL